jgi:hypothetical protein
VNNPNKMGPSNNGHQKQRAVVKTAAAQVLCMAYLSGKENNLECRKYADKKITTKHNKHHKGRRHTKLLF